MRHLAVVILVLTMVVVKTTTSKGVCILEMVDGKMQKYGDCDNKQQSQVLADLDNKLEKLTNQKSCRDVTKSSAKVRNTTGGVFDIYPESTRKVEVYCDLETDGGGWTVFQRRMDGSEDFYRGWNDYVRGFGSKDKEFWLGLENLHQITSNGRYELRVDLQDFYGNRAYAKYGLFSIDSSAQNYRLHISSPSGNAGDAITPHNGMEFSTKDLGRDTVGRNCAQLFRGAWWYSDIAKRNGEDCFASNLNGPYHDSVGKRWDGVVWREWKNNEILQFTEMKFRRK